MIERHFFRDRLIKSFDFDFGFCAPGSVNSIEHIYDVPQLESKQSQLIIDCSSIQWHVYFYLFPIDIFLVKEMIQNPHETKSDSFYFVNDELIMHKKATYAFDAIDYD
jgi:protein unc-119